MLGQTNQVMQGRPLFGGVTGGSKAYDSPRAYVRGRGAHGVAVQPLERRISDVETIRVDLTGPEAFGDPAGGKDLFSVVKNIATNTGDPAALARDLAALDQV